MILLRTLVFIALLPVLIVAADKAPAEPLYGSSPVSAHFDKDGSPTDLRGFPPYTEIKDPYTKRVWIVQPDGTAKAEASIPRIEGTLVFVDDKLIFSANKTAEEYTLLKAPGMKVIKFTKKQLTKENKEVDISEVVIELVDGLRFTLISSQAVPIVKIADGDYIRWKLKKE